MNKPLYTEIQRFDQYWLWILVIGMIGLLLWGIMQQVFLDIPFGSNPASDLGLILSFVFSLGMAAFIWNIKLITTIDSDKINIRFVPFYSRTIQIADIEKAYIRKYRPILEYGGYGIRLGISKKGKAYNVSGRIGLQLEMKDGSKALIGTKKSKELEKVIQQLI